MLAGEKMQENEKNLDTLLSLLYDLLGSSLQFEKSDPKVGLLLEDHAHEFSPRVIRKDLGVF